MILPISIRASETDRRFTCHGSVLAESLVPPRPEDGGGITGELLHFMIATRLVAELGATPPEGGLHAPALPKGYVLPAFDAWIVDWAVRWVRENIPQDWALLVELPIAYQYDLPRPVWVPLSEITGPIPDDHEVRDGRVCIRYVILSGHMDVFGISPDGKRSKGADWKTGPVGAEAAETNWQAASYLGLGKRAYTTLDGSEFALVQPKIDEDATSIPRISTTELTGEELERLNSVLAEQICSALENRYITDSGPKQCKYCAVAATKPYACPSLRAEEKFMKGQIDANILAELKDRPNDALLADFVISGRTLAAPVKAATEMLHERIDATGYVDAGCGKRITRKTKPGAYTVLEPVKFYNKAVADLGSTERVAAVFTPSMGALRDNLAEVRDIPKTSKDKTSAASVFDDEYRPMLEQAVSRELVIT
jgi:hypothetical protein